jgi:hypothetical protein
VFSRWFGWRVTLIILVVSRTLIYAYCLYCAILCIVYWEVSAGLRRKQEHKELLWNIEMATNTKVRIWWNLQLNPTMLPPFLASYTVQGNTRICLKGRWLCKWERFSRKQESWRVCVESSWKGDKIAKCIWRAGRLLFYFKGEFLNLQCPLVTICPSEAASSAGADRRVGAEIPHLGPTTRPAEKSYTCYPGSKPHLAGN